MRTAILLLLCAGLLAGCGGTPKPRIEPQIPVEDQTFARVAIVATNYDRAWDAENVRVRCQQVWLDRRGVPARRAMVFEQPYDGKQGAVRGSIMMKDHEGRSTRWVHLMFEIVSGENPAIENFSAGTTVEWKIPSELAQKDTIFLAVINRRARNDYSIGVVYVIDPSTGEMVQLLPSSRER
jgi:hypothetical protein